MWWWCDVRWGVRCLVPGSTVVWSCPEQCCVARVVIRPPGWTDTGSQPSDQLKVTDSHWRNSDCGPTTTTTTTNCQLRKLWIFRALSVLNLFCSSVKGCLFVQVETTQWRYIIALHKTNKHRHWNSSHHSQVSSIEISEVSTLKCRPVVLAGSGLSAGWHLFTLLGSAGAGGL